VKFRFDWKVTPFSIKYSNIIPDLKMENEYNNEVDQMPMPVGGIAAIAEKVIYPLEAKEEGIQGKVYVKVFISENGDVVATRLIKGIGHGCDEMAEEAIKKTKFSPALKNGKPVKVQVAIPILFKLH